MGKGTFDHLWEELYGDGKFLNKYPWDMIVSFIFRNYPKDRERRDIRILELGCGAGSNLWFAAREGFRVTGIDGSASAVEYAKKRFLSDNLPGEFIVGDFSELPLDDNSFDLVIDRGSVTCCSYRDSKTVIHEVHRVLKTGGKFFFNPYSERHTSFISGNILENGLTDAIYDGTLTGIGKIYFYSKREILDLFKGSWRIQSMEHCELRDELNPRATVHADWRVIAEKL